MVVSKSRYIQWWMFIDGANLLENKTSVKTDSSCFGQYIFRSFHLDHNLDQTFRSLKIKTSDS